jgi:hypothetical protein
MKKLLILFLFSISFFSGLLSQSISVQVGMSGDLSALDCLAIGGIGTYNYHYNDHIDLTGSIGYYEHNFDKNISSPNSDGVAFFLSALGVRYGFEKVFLKPYVGCESGIIFRQVESYSFNSDGYSFRDFYCAPVVGIQYPIKNHFNFDANLKYYIGGYNGSFIINSGIKLLL